MRMCCYPGCVSFAAPRDVACAVHARHQGAPCRACAGTGKTYRRLSGTTDTCALCAGSGLRTSHRRGPRETPVPVDQRGLLVQAQAEDDWDPWET